jgi:DNA-binding HxlR family transcriptional regulator
VPASEREATRELRAGAGALMLLSVPLNVEALTALAGAPLSLAELRRQVGFPAQTTMRCRLKTLSDLGLVERRRRAEFPSPVELRLADPGRELLAVTRTLKAWLAASPGGSIVLGTPAAKSAIKALAEGWSTQIVRALAVRSLPLTQLDRLIATLNYPSLERRVGAMKWAGLIEAIGTGRGGTPYRATDWLRRAIAPLAAAARWEGRNRTPDSARISGSDVEAAFLLTVPLVLLPDSFTGRCAMVVDGEGTSGAVARAGVVTEVEGGRLRLCTSRLSGSADAWVSGDAGAWMRSVAEGRPDHLDIHGDRELGRGLIDALHDALADPAGVSNSNA